MIDWLFDRLQGRRFDFGSGNAEYNATVFGNWYVQRGMYALSARWDYDEQARHLHLKAGPVGLFMTIARRAEREFDWAAEKSTLRVRKLRDGREFSTWRNWRHLGLTVEVDRNQRRVELGPFGVAVMDL